VSTEHEEIEYLSQGVNYLGFLAQELGDLRGITTLANELLQNADDAKNDDGDLGATNVTFDVTEEAFVITNDAYFRESDFERLQDVASGSKRSESGVRTTGAFGIGFISVYQVTDRPEIFSSGRHWILRPEMDQNVRIAERKDPSILREKGTRFNLPWAFENSVVRKALRVPPIKAKSLESFVNDLSEALPRAILFLKKLESIELKRNGRTILTVKRTFDGDDVTIDTNETGNVWRLIRGDFGGDASQFRKNHKGYIEENRIDSVSLAISVSTTEQGLLYATLPTEEKTGLP
jgi:hypothetical protein